MKKTKLIATIMTICLAISTLAYGVYAATNLSFTIGANIAFQVKNLFVDVEVDITGAYYDLNGTLYKVDFPKYKFTSQNNVETTDTLLDAQVTTWRTQNVQLYIGNVLQEATATVGAVLDAMKFNSNAQEAIVITATVQNLTPSIDIVASIGHGAFANANLDIDTDSATSAVIAKKTTNTPNSGTCSISYEPINLTTAFNFPITWTISIDEYTVQTYTITFEDNGYVYGGVGNPTPGSQPALVGLYFGETLHTVQYSTNQGAMTLPTATGQTTYGGGVESGWTFDHWNTAADNSGTPITWPYTPTGTITLYAMWRKTSQGVD